MYIGFFEAKHRTFQSEQHASCVPSMFVQVSCNYGARVTPICNSSCSVVLFESIDAIHEYCRAHGLEFATCTTALPSTVRTAP
jgi:hypothetical protein